jgi:hypothetical protein
MYLIACIKVTVVHEREREIRPKWPAIYTFLGRGKRWQRRTISVFGGQTSSVVRWSNKFGCSVVEQVQ